MTTITLSLPESLREFVEEQVAKGGFGSADAFLLALVREAQKREAKAKLEALLLEGLESGPATPMTPEEWADIRREVRERLESDRNGR
jgi:antitoxin ParD1/3/4